MKPRDTTTDTVHTIAPGAARALDGTARATAPMAPRKANRDHRFPVVTGSAPIVARYEDERGLTRAVPFERLQRQVAYLHEVAVRTAPRDSRNAVCGDSAFSVEWRPS
jgi:hypothetical protein